MPSPSIGSASASKSLAAWYGLMEQAERGEGWSYWCVSHGIFVVPCDELISALGDVLGALPGPHVEVAAGKGMLDLRIPATDIAPGSPGVFEMDARTALKAFRPRTVLSCFPPVDAGIERAIFADPGVEYFLYIGPEPPEARGGWRSRPIEEIETVLLTRLDHLLDFTRNTHRRGAAAILYSREKYALQA
jgi:hypothetical protein